MRCTRRWRLSPDVFERNLPVEVLSSRELAGRNLLKYKLIVLPYPLMMTHEEAGH